MFKSRAIAYFFYFGMAVTIISLPFFWGIMRPVFDTKNAFMVIYGVLNLPVTLLLKDFTWSIAQMIWDNPTVSQVDLITVDVSVIFWALVGFVVGIIADARRAVRA